MEDSGGLLFWGVLIVMMVVFMFLPQYMNRRRTKQREKDLAVGDGVITIGGFMGELTYLDWEGNLARIKLAEGVEISILPSAISGKRAEAATDDSEPGAA